MNFDHRINIFDVTALIAYLLGDENICINENKADMDMNGKISIHDVTEIIKWILNSRSSAANDTDVAEEALLAVGQAVE